MQIVKQKHFSLKSEIIWLNCLKRAALKINAQLFLRDTSVRRPPCLYGWASDQQQSSVLRASGTRPATTEVEGRPLVKRRLERSVDHAFSTDGSEAKTGKAAG